MNDNVQRAYNAIAMLMPESVTEATIALDRMDEHQLRSTAWRIAFLLGETDAGPGDNLDALAYMAGYEK